MKCLPCAGALGTRGGAGWAEHRGAATAAGLPGEEEEGVALRKADVVLSHING